MGPGLLDMMAMDPRMQRTTLPSPMGLKPMMQGADLQRGMMPPAAPGMSDVQKLAMMKAGQGMATNGVNLQSMAQVAAPLLDMWQQKRKATGQGGILSGLLNR